MKQLLLWSLKRQEADNCIRFNTKNYSGTEKRRQMTLPGERLHISRQKVPRSWIRTAAGNADSGTCRFHSDCYSGEGQHLSEIPGKVSAHVLCELQAHMCMHSQCSCLLWRGSVGIHSSGLQTGKGISISQQGSTKPQTPSSLSGVSGIHISKNLRWKGVALPRGLHFWTAIIHMGHFI